LSRLRKTLQRKVFEPNRDDQAEIWEDVGMDSSSFMFQVMFPRRQIITQTIQSFKSQKEKLNNERRESRAEEQLGKRKHKSTNQETFPQKSDVETPVRQIISKYVKLPLLLEVTEDGNHASFRFCVPSNYVELILCELQGVGIGRVEGSSMSVLPLSIHYSPSMLEERVDHKEKLDKFYASIKSRMIVAEVVARIRSGTQFTFDYLLLLLVASVIAFVGLVVDSSVILVASMLVSPIMGPILAGVFGAVIQDRKLAIKGVIHESQSLFICIVTGFLLGLCVCPVVQTIALSQWPTQEMLSRGAPRSLILGILVAIPSGAGVAISVLGGNSGSLVGVAISASLLPPAVNAGFFWALAVVLAVSGEDSKAGFYALPGHNETILAYLPHYSSNLALESLVLGLVSLLLTLLNILCIIVTGFFILRLKEVTPEKIPQQFSSFWRKDIRAHRNYNRTLGDREDSNNTADTTGDGLDGTYMQTLFDLDTLAAREEELVNIRKWLCIPGLPSQATDIHARLDSTDPLRTVAGRVGITGTPLLGVATAPLVGVDGAPLLVRGIHGIGIPSFMHHDINRSRSFGSVDTDRRHKKRVLVPA